jgi:hypothetical protein
LSGTFVRNAGRQSFRTLPSCRASLLSRLAPSMTRVGSIPKCTSIATAQRAGPPYQKAVKNSRRCPLKFGQFQRQSRGGPSDRPAIADVAAMVRRADNVLPLPAPECRRLGPLKCPDHPPAQRHGSTHSGPRRLPNRNGIPAGPMIDDLIGGFNSAVFPCFRGVGDHCGGDESNKSDRVHSHWDHLRPAPAGMAAIRLLINTSVSFSRMVRLGRSQDPPLQTLPTTMAVRRAERGYSIDRYRSRASATGSLWRCT